MGIPGTANGKRGRREKGCTADQEVSRGQTRSGRRRTNPARSRCPEGSGQWDTSERCHSCISLPLRVYRTALRQQVVFLSSSATITILLCTLALKHRLTAYDLRDLPFHPYSSFARLVCTHHTSHVSAIVRNPVLRV